jgi:signal transduction histidine kinase
VRQRRTGARDPTIIVMRMPLTPLARDGLLAAVLTVATQAELVLAADAVQGPLAVQHVTFAVMTMSTALRRVAPVLAVVICSTGLLAQTVAGSAPVVGGFLAMLVVVASMGYHASLRRGSVGMAATAVGGFSYEVVTGTAVLGDVVGNTVVVVGTWLLAHALRTNVRRRVTAEVSRDRAAREAAEAERTRITRDLHDSVSHALTVMTLHAGAARERTDGPVHESLRSIEQAGRHAMADMHRVLRLLGSDGAGAPGLADLDGLVAGVRETGLDVSLHLDPSVGDLPPSVGTTVFRIVQEGLTNVLKHAQAAHADVEVGREGDVVRVLVCDDGSPSPAEHTVLPGAGRGLEGLRRRVRLFGGDVATAPGPTGGWRVDASIPLPGPQG